MTALNVHELRVPFAPLEIRWCSSSQCMLIILYHYPYLHSHWT